MTKSPNPRVREPQLAYSDIQSKMQDERTRRQKAQKIIRVLHHYLGRADLKDLSTLDIGCSVGIIASELAADGALSTGVDIDVPGLEAAQARFGDRVTFICASADDLAMPDESVDVVVFNHIYEHVVDADAVVNEIYRVLKPTGVVYLGLANKFQLMEPHYGLPLLSWLPQKAADKYIRYAGRASHYYESHLSRAGLKQLLRGFHIYDYTVPIIRHPDVFGSSDQVKSLVSRLPAPLIQALIPIVPTYIWLGTKRQVPPQSPVAGEGLRHLDLTGAGRH
jgi:2-polyprenyl-3-methyl-5-hydroxy-6-metoxy-1,4-benzoquinol methylase